MVEVGIDAIGFYTSRYYLTLADLANARGVSFGKYEALGQEKMSVLPPNEDIVTMGASAAAQVIRQIDLNEIDTLLFATESGFDQSKSAGIYVHRLLKLPEHCRVLELKQACYGASGGLQMAAALVTRYPNKKVLLIASDVARYALHSNAESSQGCGAVAMLISNQPRLLLLESEYGVYTEDVMDFWRPNYCDSALVDGRYSTVVYLRSLERVWRAYQAYSKRGYHDHDFYCYHTPVPRIVEKAHKFLAKLNGRSFTFEEEVKQEVENFLKYATLIGNSYAAALYIGLASLLNHNQNDLSEKRIGFYSYGSGCVAEYFSGIVQPEYKKQLDSTWHDAWLEERTALSYDEYETFYNFKLPQNGEVFQTSHHKTGGFQLLGIENHKRIYEEGL